MSETDQTTLVADLARVRDDDLVSEATSRRAQQLLSEIVAAPAPAPATATRRRRVAAPRRFAAGCELRCGSCSSRRRRHHGISGR